MYPTKYHYRINPITQSPTGHTWLFLPGGLGLGSDYLAPFIQQLQLPGSKLVADFPLDGCNNQGELDFKLWHDGLVDLVRSLANPVLVTHDFSAMFALSNMELEPHLSGLVLMNTTTENNFVEHINTMRAIHQLPDLAPAAAAYHLNPTQTLYKEFWHAYKFYYFTAAELAKGEEMMRHFAFNNSAYYYGLHHFYPDYQCRWSPNISTMTLSGENDYICSPHVLTKHHAFQKPNMNHYVIADAGHCPWLMHLAQVQQCFNAFINTL